MLKINVWSGLILILAFVTFVTAQSSKQSINNLGIRNEKAVREAVRVYFNWQYASGKEGVSQSTNLKPSAISARAQDFLQKKQDYLEVSEFSNQVNDVIIADQNFSLEFSNLHLTREGLVSVEVLENYERRYEYSETPTKGTVGHRIYLAWINKNWEIVNDEIEGTDAPPSDFDKYSLMEEIREQAINKKIAEQDLLKNSGISQSFLDEQIKLFVQQGLSQKQIDERLAEIVNRKTDDYLGRRDLTENSVPDLLTNRSYNRQNAQNYINAWCCGVRNPRWGNFDGMGGDCTNYVSQILNAGGIPQDYSGSQIWFYTNMSNRAPSWSGVIPLWSYLQGNTSGNGYNGPQATLRTDSGGHTAMQTGDLIQLYNTTGTNQWSHTYGVHHAGWVRVCPWYNPFCSTMRYKVYVTSHTSDKWADDIDQAAPQFTKRYAHIEGWRAP